MDSSISNTLSRESVYESMSMLSAAMEDAAGRLAEKAKPEAISNEEIRKGDVILKGKFGEMWTSKLPKVISTYTKPDGSGIFEDDFADRDVWIDLITRAEPETYYAMHVPLDVSVTVKTAWGDELHTNLPNAPHGNGDYLVCRTNEKGEPDLSDVWVLNGFIFPEYYDTDSITNDANNKAA